jgi:hypothetical protein
MIDKEWAVINQAFIKWLHPDNFDSDGLQKVRLGDIRARIKSYIEGNVGANFMRGIDCALSRSLKTLP